MADEGISFARAHARELRKMGLGADDNLAGLALSGGGIRSATFNLGVLQALAKSGLLSRLDYLSTVSGGGYIGSWLSAWIARPGCDVDKVERALANDREPDEVSFLREYSNYLTPRVGWLTADTLTMAATYLRNLLLNFTIIVSWFAIFMLVPWGLVHFGMNVAPSALLWSSVVLLLFAVGFIVANVVWQEFDENRPADVRPGADRAPFFARAVWINWLIVLPLLLWAYAISTALRHAPELLDLAAWSGVAVGCVAAFVVLRQLLLRWGARKRKVTGRFSFWRRGFAFIVGTLAAVALVAVLTKQFGGVSQWHVLVWGVPAMLGVFLLGATLVLGISGRTESEYAREWWSRLGGLVFRVMAVWIVLSGAAIYGPLLAAQLSAFAAANLSAAWLLTTLASVLVGKSPATGGESSSRWVELIPRIGPYVFILGLLILVSTALYAGLVEYPWHFQWPETYFQALDALDPARAAVLAGGLFALASLLSWAIDVNLFSFHMFYRNRLVRCYLGASRPGERSALPFIGFDPKDNPDLKRLRRRPYHIINTALNLTSSKRLRWQERRAASFVLTRDHCGYEYLGASGTGDQKCFQPTRFYAKNSRGSLNLGTAMAISGAAANPNMGYHSSPSVAFLLTVFNVRLGWWMQNTSSGERWCAGGPHFGLWYLIRELFGISTDETRFVQLSDGGHFDNLGLYELVRRRCRFIIVTDASADPRFEFEDLGNSIRKCFIDQGVDVEIDRRAIVPETGQRQSLHHCAVGTIRYKDGSAPGYLVYIKPSLTGNEPADVAQFAVANPTFPHETTGDQFFSESQFESYRKLGFHIVHAVIADAVAKAEGSRKHNASGVALAAAKRPIDLEALFVALKERWSAPVSASASAFAKHGDQFSKLQDTLRTDPRLAFLNAQVYPEWEAVLTAPPTAPARRSGEGERGDAADVADEKTRREGSAARSWLPLTAEERRAGFHFCNGMLQLMENVYVDLNLQQEHTHPDNRGWMNLFRQWSWSGMFRVTYAVCCSMYGARFQTFCEIVLQLVPGEVCVTRVPLRASHRLNFVEQEVLRRLRSAQAVEEGDEIWLLQSIVRSPESGDDAAEATHRYTYTFGFAVMRGDAILYFRVQDHVRRMGHARESLAALMTSVREAQVERGIAAPAGPENRTDMTMKAPVQWLEPQDFDGFSRLFRSVRQQRTAAPVRC